MFNIHETKQILSILTSILLLSSSVYAASFTYAEGDDVVGELQTITAAPGDSFASLARKYGLSLHEIKEANPDIAKVRPQQKVLIPTEFILPPKKYREGIVVNMPELRLYFFRPDGKTVDTYPVAMGRPGWRTPIMKTTIIEKEVQPVWHVPADIHDYMLNTHGIDLPEFVPPGPRNPLGPYALHVGNSGYLIHGNNQPSSIGTYASSGCMRMYNEDVTDLFPHVPVGTVIYITNHQYKAGWRGRKLFFKAQEPVDSSHEDTELGHSTIEGAIAEATMNHSTQVNWPKVHAIAEEETGVPEQVNE